MPTPTLAIEIAAVVLAALSGMITASRKQADLVGAYALALVTSFAAARCAMSCSSDARCSG